MKHCWCQSNVWCDTFTSCIFLFSSLPAMYVRLWCDVKHWRARANYETPSKRGGAMKNNKSNNQHISLCFTMLKLCSLDIFFLFSSLLADEENLVINFDVTWWNFSCYIISWCFIILKLICGHFSTLIKSFTLKGKNFTWDILIQTHSSR